MAMSVNENISGNGLKCFFKISIFHLFRQKRIDHHYSFLQLGGEDFVIDQVREIIIEGGSATGFAHNNGKPLVNVFF